ncbi:MAG TPA: hypothetical protein VHV08_11815, partial [Pirellulales bacterium]|nr:hypothetical protein [Pirellulales bacterium]
MLSTALFASRGTMMDQAIAGAGASKSSRFGRLAAMVSALVVAWAVSVAPAAEPIVTRLPPVPAAPLTDADSDNPSNCVVINPAGSAIYPEAIDFEGTIRPGYTGGEHQLVSLQEPALPTPSLMSSAKPLLQQAPSPRLSKAGRERPGLFHFTSKQDTADAPDEPGTDGPDADGPDADSDMDNEKDKEKKEGEPQKYGREPESNTMQFLRTQDV